MTLWPTLALVLATLIGLFLGILGGGEAIVAPSTKTNLKIQTGACMLMLTLDCRPW